MASTGVDTDPVSIQANRFGQITARQYECLKPTLGGAVGSVISLMVWLLAPIPLGIFALYLAWQLAQAQVGVAWIGVILMLGIAALVAGLFWWLAVMPFIRRARLRHDLSEGLIAQAEGQVIFERSGYVARANGRLLLATDGSREIGLMPGPYRFYFLPRMGWLLSAEALGPLMAVQPHAGVLDALAQAHHFDLSDLAANRQGQLSTRQRLGLTRGVVGLQVVTLGALALLVWMLVSAPQTEPWSALILGLILAGIAYATYRRVNDLLGGQVVWLEGVISRVEDSSGDSSSYYYVLAGQRFSVSSTAYAALVESLRYRLYYTPRTKKLVSIEPLP
jgi:hypothetical protein